MAALRILGRTSSINVRKVLWTLDEIGATDEHEDAWATPERPTGTAEFLALNPNGLVPVIVDESGPLWESHAICRYLARKHERHDLLPRDPAAAAAVEQWMDWLLGDLNAAYVTAFLGLVRKHPAHSDPDRIAGSLIRWNVMMTRLDAHLAKGGPYMTGRHLTMADIVLGLAAHRWEMTPFEHPNLPHVAGWLARLRARDAARPLLSTQYP
jgi:glutathione S-transferase